MKKFKKLIQLVIIIIFTLVLAQSVFAAELNFTTDHTNGTTDDTFQVHLSVDGQVDNGQVGIDGLENFNVIGQQSSSQVQVINGAMTSVQEKIITLQPKTAGEFEITALAQENGEVIKSETLKFIIKKSLIQETKDKLLNKTDEDGEISELSTEASEDSLKNTLMLPNAQKTSINQSNANTSTEQLKKLETKSLTTFPKVEHLTPFNAIFWLEMLGVTALIMAIFYIIIKTYNKK